MFDITRHRLFKMAASLLLSLALLCVYGVTPASAFVSEARQYPVDNIDGIISDVPTGGRWLQHWKKTCCPSGKCRQHGAVPLATTPPIAAMTGLCTTW